MTSDHLDAILKSAQTKGEKDGWHVVPDGGTLTLYVSHEGASLTVARVEALRTDGDLVFARTQKRDVYALARAGLFAVAVEGTAAGSPARRAGFG